MLGILCLVCCPASVVSGAEPGIRIPVTVTVKGDPPSKEEIYSFVLQGQDKAPLPKENVLQIKGKGNSLFGEILYQAPGIYNYTLKQEPGNNKNGHYDKSIYYITVTVSTGENGQLEASVAAHRDSEKKGEKSEIIFINTYERKVTPFPTETGIRKTAAENNPVRTVVAGSSVAVKASTKPRTGDDTNILLWIGLLSGAGVMLVLLYVLFIKKQNHKK